jgi:hypothetical protein
LWGEKSKSVLVSGEEEETEEERKEVVVIAAVAVAVGGERKKKKKRRKKKQCEKREPKEHPSSPEELQTHTSTEHTPSHTNGKGAAKNFAVQVESASLEGIQTERRNRAREKIPNKTIKLREEALRLAVHRRKKCREREREYLALDAHLVCDDIIADLQRLGDHIQTLRISRSQKKCLRKRRTIHRKPQQTWHQSFDGSLLPLNSRVSTTT